MNISKRHHYLPQFYIKGFTGADGKVSVYNKSKRGIDNNRKSPKQVFFEWNRNTFQIQGVESDFIEKNYTFFENLFSPTYKKIIEEYDEISLEPYDVLQLMLFVSLIYRRIPEQDDDTIEYLKNLTQKNSFLGIRNKNTGEEASSELFEKVINEPSFVGVSKIIRTIQDYLRIDRTETAKNWKLSYLPKEFPQLHLLSDTPLIIENNSSNELLNSTSIFPFSKGITVYNSGGKKLNQITPESTIWIDILTFVQAKEFVCGPDEDYLKLISETAEGYKTSKSIELLRKKVFEIFE